MTSPTIRTILNSLTALLVVTGVLVWLKEPVIPRVDLPAQRVSASREALATPGPAASGNATTIVTSNIFAASRMAPPRRYTPPGADGSVVDPTTEQMQPDVTTPFTPLPRVYGTMTGPDGAKALIQPDTTGASSRLYREGDRVGVFRIEKILTASVIVRGPAGRQELKVEQREEPRK